MIPTREQLIDMLKHVNLADDPEWLEALSEAEVRRLVGNILRLAVLGLLVHPETSASTQADLDFEVGTPDGVEEIFVAVRMQALELEK
jgi:hypothetical protein